MTGRGEGFDTWSIRRLYQELDLDLETIDLVIHLRSQIVDLQREIKDLEKRSHWCEQNLLAEIQTLRQQQQKT